MSDVVIALALFRAITDNSANLIDFDASIARMSDIYLDRASFKQRMAVTVGDSVKVGAANEFFFVTIVEKLHSGVLIGRVDNELKSTERHGLKDGDAVIFDVRHIRSVSDADEVSIYDTPVTMVVDKASGELTYGDDRWSGEYLTVEAYREMVVSGEIMDQDGHGRVLRNTILASGPDGIVHPSWIMRLPADATHVLWFNK